MTPADYCHAFSTFLGLPPTTDQRAACGAELPRDWNGTGKPLCPACAALVERERGAS